VHYVTSSISDSSAAAGFGLKTADWHGRSAQPRDNRGVAKGITDINHVRAKYLLELQGDYRVNRFASSIL
jgi:hypothetical protein